MAEIARQKKRFFLDLDTMSITRIAPPFRRVYALLWLGTIVVRLPWWIIWNLHPALRPRKSWTLTKAVGARIIRDWLHIVERCNLNVIFSIPSYRKLEVGNGVKGVYVDGAPELVTGKVKEWADKAGIGTARIPGYWMHKEGMCIETEQQPENDEKILYFLHGGAYMLFSAHPSFPSANIPLGMLRICPSVKRAFAIEYRLSSVSPETTTGQFPSALLDALAGYNYLVNCVGYSPSQIILVGDSAGGNLALALTRYLTEYRGSVPKLPDVPSALVLLSPWTDMSGSNWTPASSHFANLDSDIINFFEEPYKVDAPPSFIEPFGTDFASQTPYISPACKYLGNVSFDGFPRTFISAGDAEVLLDQIRELSRRMKDKMGSDKVIYYEAKDAFHDYLPMTFAEPERTETLKALAQFVEEDT